jgi:cardiolipin synthase A/B
VVVALVPGDPMPELARYRAFPGIAAGYDALAALGGFAGFCLAAPAARRSWGYEEIYVHSKTMVVDDRWATIGSANLIFTSFQGDTEMNVSFWDSEVARAFRVRQVDEQGGFESAAMGGREAVGRLAEVAGDNADRRARGEDLAGFACQVDPTTWAT